MPIPEKIGTAVVVKSVSQESDGLTLELEIPAFNSKYPTYVNRIMGPDALRFKPGWAGELILLRGNIKKTKEGTPKSGQYHSDYYWNFGGFGGEDQDAPFGAEEHAPSTLTEAAAKAPKVSPAASGNGWREAYAQSEECKILERTSIERQKALDLAVQWCIKNEATDTYHVIVYAKRFAHFLKTGEIPPDMQPKKPAEGT